MLLYYYSGTQLFSDSSYILYPQNFAFFYYPLKTNFYYPNYLVCVVATGAWLHSQRKLSLSLQPTFVISSRDCILYPALMSMLIISMAWACAHCHKFRYVTAVLSQKDTFLYSHTLPLTVTRLLLTLLQGSLRLRRGSSVLLVTFQLLNKT